MFYEELPEQGIRREFRTCHDINMFSKLEQNDLESHL